MTFLITLITLLPQILQFIVQVNDLFKSIPNPAGQKQGAVKKQLLMDTILIANPNQKIADAVSLIVDKSVGTLKTVGWDDPPAPAVKIS